MNLKKLLKIANKLDQMNQFNKADQITHHLIRISEEKVKIDPTTEILKSLDKTLNDPNLFKEVDVVEKEPAQSVDDVKPVDIKGGPKEFLDKLSGPAQAASMQTGGEIPASVILAIGAWESGWGKSELAKQGNYFGIKSSPTSGGSGSVKMKTFEFDGGKREEMANFATFNKDAISSMAALPNFLKNNPRYKQAIKAGELYKNTKNLNDLDRIVDAIFDAGYSTDEAEPGNIKKLIRMYNLKRFD